MTPSDSEIARNDEDPIHFTYDHDDSHYGRSTLWEDQTQQMLWSSGTVQLILIHAINILDRQYVQLDNRVAQIKNVIVLMTYFLLSDH